MTNSSSDSGRETRAIPGREPDASATGVSNVTRALLPDNRLLAARQKERDDETVIPIGTGTSPSAGHRAPDDWLLDMALKVGYEAGRPGPKRTRRLEGIIIHATKGGPESGALEKVKKAEKGVTWHFTITRDGKIYQHVALSHIAGHAGDGILDVEGKRIKDVNAVTLGIELGNWGPHVIETVEGASGANKTKVFRYLPVKPSVNRHRPERSEQILPMPGYLLEQVGTLPLDGRETPMWWEKYPEAQIDALVALIKRLQTTQWAHATAKIVGHDAVALNPRGRKVDPGANFPWHRILPLAIQQSTKEEPFGVQKPRKPEG